MNNKYTMDMQETIDRVTAERDAALGREVDLVERTSELRQQVCALAQNLKFAEEGYQSFAEECDKLQQRLTATDERAHVLLGLLREARQYHGVMLMSDPPQNAWKYHRMNERIDEITRLNTK